MLPLESFAPHSILPFLPPLTRLFLLFFFVVCVYALFSFSRILLRLRSFKKQWTGEASRSILPSLSELRYRAANLHQLLLFTSYLFALCFLLQIPSAFIVIENSRRPVLSIIFNNLAVYIAYAVDVFFVFLVLHSIQWFVAARIDSTTLRSNASRADNQQ